MTRPHLGYLLFDLPSDHEVEAGISTESMVIQSIIHNRDSQAVVKRICVASVGKMKKCPTYKYNVQFVHLACHGGRRGIAMLGGSMAWGDAISQIKKYLNPLVGDEQRVIAFSCCHSCDGLSATRQDLTGYFTGAYYFRTKTISFARAITIWSMFYLKKGTSRPHSPIVQAINGFIGKDVLAFTNI